MAALRAVHLTLASECSALCEASAASRATAVATRARSRRLQMPTLRVTLSADQAYGAVARRRVDEQFAHHPPAVLAELQEVVSGLAADASGSGQGPIDLRVCERLHHFHVDVSDDGRHLWAHVPHEGGVRPDPGPILRVVRKQPALSVPPR